MKTVKEIRKELKLSQSELGRIIDLTQAHISKIESGIVPEPVYYRLALKGIMFDRLYETSK